MGNEGGWVRTQRSSIPIGQCGSAETAQRAKRLRVKVDCLGVADQPWRSRPNGGGYGAFGGLLQLHFANSSLSFSLRHRPADGGPDEDQNMLMNNRERMSAELREAIASHQLFLMYQPLVEIDISCILGLEALVQLASSFGRHHGAR